MKTEARAHALLDIPAGLSEDQRRAYIRGYAKGAVRYVRRNGPPSINGPVTNAKDRDELHRITVEHEWLRHPVCHKAGLAELRKWNKLYTVVEERLAS